MGSAPYLRAAAYGKSLKNRYSNFMKRYLLLLGVVSLIFLIMYGVAEAMKIPLLTDPRPLMSTAGLTAAVTGIGLLIADVVLPTPSSLVMVAHGALFGIVVGTVLSLIGRAGSFAFGYYLGLRSHTMVKRYISEEELEKSKLKLARWGLVAIVGTRPLPIISETTSIAAGMSRMNFGWSLLAATAGSIPEALLFAITGAVAGTFLNTSYVFLAIIVMMLVFWALSSKLKTCQPA